MNPVTRIRAAIACLATLGLSCPGPGRVAIDSLTNVTAADIQKSVQSSGAAVLMLGDSAHS